MVSYSGYHAMDQTKGMDILTGSTAFGCPYSSFDASCHPHLQITTLPTMLSLFIPSIVAVVIPLFLMNATVPELKVALAIHGG